MMSDIFPPAHPHLISLESPFLLFSVYMQPLGSLAVSVFLSSVGPLFVSLCLWRSPPNLLLACMTNRTCEEERRAPSQPSRGCFRWRGHPYRCVFSEKSRVSGGLTVSSGPPPLYKPMSFFYLPRPYFHDPWYAVGDCRNSSCLTGGAPNTSFLFFSPFCLSS